METLLINEQFVFQFKYWGEGQMRTGMRFRHNLFEYVNVFDHCQRHHVFDLVERLAEAGKEVIVTASPTQYRVWVNLRFAETPAFKQMSSASVQVALSQSAHPSLLLETLMSA